MRQIKAYYDKESGKVVLKDSDLTTIPTYKGRTMELLEVHTEDTPNEKHVPVLKPNGQEITIEIGAIPHPMAEAHFITDIFMITNKGIESKKLSPEDKPQAKFALKAGETLEGAFAYCNLHGLWFQHA